MVDLANGQGQYDSCQCYDHEMSTNVFMGLMEWNALQDECVSILQNNTIPTNNSIYANLFLLFLHTNKIGKNEKKEKYCYGRDETKTENYFKQFQITGKQRV